MVSKVVMTRKAQAQLREYIRYIRFRLKNSQAASSVMADARKTKAALLNVADSLKYCDDEELKDLGYKTIHFHTHNNFSFLKFVAAPLSSLLFTMIFKIMKTFLNRKSSEPEDFFFISAGNDMSRRTSLLRSCRHA